MIVKLCNADDVARVPPALSADLIGALHELVCLGRGREMGFREGEPISVWEVEGVVRAQQGAVRAMFFEGKWVDLGYCWGV